jgi:hypothetical protein
MKSNFPFSSNTSLKKSDILGAKRNASPASPQSKKLTIKVLNLVRRGWLSVVTT